MATNILIENMKYETLIWIILGVLVIIGFISLIIILKSDNKRYQAGKIGKIVLQLICILLIFKIICENSVKNYSLSSIKNEWEELEVPQIDSLMYLSQLNGSTMIYYSFSKEPIVHSRKKIDFDLSSTYKIIDEFDNKKEGLRLQLSFVKKSFFRKEKRINILLKKKDFKFIIVDSISETQRDSILKAWGFDNKLYIRNDSY